MQLIAYRVSLIESQTENLFAQLLTDQVRYDLIANAIRNNTSFNYRNTIYIFYNVESNEFGVAGRIGRPDNVEISRPDEAGVLVDSIEATTEWVHFVFGGTGDNILLVQRDQSFFSGGLEGLASIVAGLISTGLNDNRYTVLVNPITQESDFWTIVRDSQSVHRLELEMVAPNPLRSRNQFAEIVEYNHTLYNASKFSTSIENDNAGLTIQNTNESLREQVDYVAAGGGTWGLTVRDADNRKRDYKSTDASVAQTVALDDVEETHSNLLHFVGRLLEHARRLLR